MDDQSFAEHEIMRAIGFMEQKLPADWAGPAMWADMTQQAARLILSLGDSLTPAQLSVLMALGAMAHRQCTAEKARGEGND